MNDSIDNKQGLSTRNKPIPQAKLSHGSLKGKIPIRLDDRTTLYVDYRHNVNKAIERYAKHMYSFAYIDKSGNVCTKENTQPDSEKMKKGKVKSLK
ncbi:MAG: hypothetical protein M0P47_09335 [Bacteroidales bacterium]|jgi:hypothetical protein|nr:hypothetical protein [Bacteroidales bacterium]